jgi:adenylate kinase
MALGMIILGRQGSGKGTQAARIAHRYGVVHISTGDMLRSAVADDVINGIVDERLAKADVVDGGFLLDGYPRTPGQADALVGFVGERLQLALNLDVSVDVVTERMMARGREDDSPESIARRLQLYEAETAPLLSWAEDRGILTVIDGLGGENDVFARLSVVIDAI